MAAKKSTEGMIKCQSGAMHYPPMTRALSRPAAPVPAVPRDVDREAYDLQYVGVPVDRSPYVVLDWQGHREAPEGPCAGCAKLTTTTDCAGTRWHKSCAELAMSG